MLAAVSLVTSPNASGAYNAGDQIIIQVEFEAPVTITSGNPILRLNSGNYATFAGQSGAGATLNFLYQVRGPVAGVGGDNSADLDVLDGAAIQNATFSWSGGTFVPVLPVGTGAGVTNSLAFMRDIVIDTTPPATPVVNELRVNPLIEQTNPGFFQAHPDYFTLTGTAGTGPLTPGQTLTVTVNGCTYVLVPGSVGAPDSTGAWRVDLLQPPTSGGPLNPWSTTSIQQYQVEAVLSDAAGNTSVGRGFVVIDMVGPTVENVTAANPDGAYRAGDVIDVLVYFLEPVEVVGVPQLALGLDSVGGGAAGRVMASYDPAKSGGNLVVFSYTIQAGDTDADLEYEILPGSTPPSAIELNGGMIQDGAGNPANLLMPAPGAGTAGTLGYNKDIEIDTTAPAVPAVVSVTDDVPPVPVPVTIASPSGVTNDNAPLISGTADAGTTVRVYDGAGGTLLGIATLVGTNWTFQATGLADGTYNFVATATDAAGNVSAATTPAYTVTVDTTAPPAPVITGVDDDRDANGNLAPATNVPNNGFTNDTQLVLNGTAQPGTTVEIYNGTTRLGVATLVGNAWSYVTPVLVNGVTYSFNAIATDAAGNTGPASLIYTVTVDTTAPVKPIIQSVTDDVLPIASQVLSGGRTNDTVLFLSGTCEANAVVQVFHTLNGVTTLLGTASVAGTSWAFTTGTLADGTYAFTATATDAAGNVSGVSDPYTVTVDTIAPNAPAITGVEDGVLPTIGNVANGGFTNDTILVLRGTAEAGSTVHVYEGATLLGTATLTGTTWDFTTGTLADGTTYSFTARAIDVAGNESGPTTPPYVVTVDTTAPAVPTIADVTDTVGTITGSIASGGTTNDPNPIISGTMAAGTVLVEIFDNGGAFPLVGTFTALSSTTWSFVPALPLADGVHALTAVAVDGAGNRSSVFLPAYVITVDTIGLVPAITGVADNVLPLQGNVANGGFTNDTTLVLTGTAEAGSIVEIYDDAGTSPILLGLATLSGTSWTFTTGTLAEGKFEFVARIIDAVGNTSDFCQPYTVTVDLTAPVRPTITGVVDDVLEITGAIPNGGVTNDTTLVIEGMAEPGAIVLIYESGALFGQATADATGFWSCPTGVLVGGTTYSFTATATDAAGNVSNTSLPAYDITIDLVAPGLPTIASVNADSGVVPPGGATNDATLSLTGTTDAGTRVHIFNGGTLLGEASVAGTAWTFAFTSPLASGTYAFRARSMDVAGNTTFSTVYAVTIDTVAPNAPAITGADDNVAPVTRTLASGERTNDTVLVLRGTAEAGSTVLVYDGSTLLGTATLLGTSWTFTTAALADGTTYLFNATATDAVGNTSAPSAPFIVTIDTTAPAAPTITGVTDDVQLGMGVVPNGGLTNDTQLAIAGSAEAGSIVSIYNGLTLLGTTTATTGGTWSFTTGVLASNVTYAFRATATDAAGNVSVSSAPDYMVTVDADAPPAPVITDVVDDVAPLVGTVADGGSSNDTSLLVTGACSDAVRVDIFNGAALIGSTVPVSGAWSYLATGLINGATYRFSAVSVDAAGNVSAPSAPWAVTIDTVAPPTPTIIDVQDDTTPALGTVGNGGYTNDTSLRLTISTDPTPGVVTAVSIFDGSTLLGQATAQGGGQWTFLAVGLLNGSTYGLTAVASDAANNASAPSAPWIVTIDTVAPPPPTIAGTVSGGLVTLTGTTEVFSSVDVYVSGLLIGTATVVGGNWSLILPMTPDGTYIFSATATDRAGNVSLPSLPTAVTVDTTPPAAPINMQVYDDVGTLQGVLTSGAVTDDNILTITGTAEPNSTVRIRSNGVLLAGSTSAGAGGNWTYVTPALSDGMHVLTAEAVDSYGNVGQQTAGFAVTIDTVAPSVPAITQVFDSVAPVIGYVLNGGTTNDPTLTLSGTGAAGSTVRIFDGMTLIGTVALGNATTWTLTTAALADGTHVFTADAVDVAGNVSGPSAGFTVTIDTIAPSTAPTIASIVDNVGSVVGVLADGAETDDSVLVLSGVAPAGTATVVIYDNGVVIGEVTPASGSWTFTTPNLGEGPHSFSVTAADAAGNESVPSGIRTVIVDLTPPSAPVIDQALDNFGKVQGKVVKNSATDDTTPQLTGYMDADTVRVAIYRNGVYVGNATLTGPTTWSFSSASLLNGTYTFTARAYDAAGNESAESSPPYTVTVVGPITASSPTFPASPLRSVSPPITTFSVVFNQPVTGFSASNLRLFLGTRSVAIRGATVTQAAGSDGTVWVVSLPRTSINLKGTYRLDITGASIVSLLTGASMTGVSSLSWRRI